MFTIYQNISCLFMKTLFLENKEYILIAKCPRSIWKHRTDWIIAKILYYCSILTLFLSSHSLIWLIFFIDNLYWRRPQRRLYAYHIEPYLFCYCPCIKTVNAWNACMKSFGAETTKTILHLYYIIGCIAYTSTYVYEPKKFRTIYRITPNKIGRIYS